MASKGATALRRWLEEERRSQDWLAKQLEVHQTTVSIWLHGTEPRASHAAKIEEITGVAVALWGETDESVAAAG
jgi:transcriptional regulator with XRE-family HTH domain